MPRNYEPEYRRRIREKTEDNRRQAERERRDRETQNAIDGITQSIREIKTQTEAYNKNEDSKWEDERRWQKREVLALVAAAVVGIIAIVVASCDSHRQRSIMSEQLAQTQLQLNITRIELSANWTREILHTVVPDPFFPQKLLGWEINPHWVNVGKTDAREVRGWFDIRVLTKQIIGDDQCPSEAEKPIPFPPPVITRPSGQVTLPAKELFVEDANRAQRGEAIIYILGHLEWRDVFYPTTPLHHSDWCYAAYPNDIQNNQFSFFINYDRDESSNQKTQEKADSPKRGEPPK